MSHSRRAVRHVVTTFAIAASLAITASPVSAADVSGDLEPVGSQRAAEQRREPTPQLTKVAERPARTQIPADRYAMAGGCYTMATDGGYLTKSAGAYSLGQKAAAAPIHFQATELGRYLLWDADRQFINHDSAPAAQPAESTEWGIDGASNNFTFDAALLGQSSGWRFEMTTGCPEWPEVELDVTGAPFAGVSSLQETRGYADDHMHATTGEFLGGGIHCGRPWHKYGVEYALADCLDHSTTKGYLALPEIVLSGNASHDPTGWPTFKDWPSPESLTHEGAYYKWLERSWRGGQRIYVNLLVENEVLCVLYPNLANPTANVPGVTKNCNDMDQVRRQAKMTRDLENYIDAQWGGPGKGWFRIVDNPEDTRRIINQGKLAVILGTETSDIFNCSKGQSATDLLDQIGIANPISCSADDLDAGLDELYDLGVRQMVITHKFDNAFGGAKGDSGFNGIATNLGNFLITGSFFRMKPCTDGFAPDNTQLGPNDIPSAELSKLFGLITGGIAGLPLPVALPLYAPGDQCNERGLTELGKQMIRKMTDRHMLVDVDHFNSRSRSQALDLLEGLGYSGVLSSHSWSDDDAYPRVYGLGGFVAPYAGGSEGFVNKWRDMSAAMDGKYYWGMGYGADMNGLGAQGGPRGADVDNPVTYPFTTFGNVTVDQQHSGERVYDINADGVAQYGLYPDWIQDLKILGGPDIQTDMLRGAEAYLQTWERANGATNDACRQPELRRPASDFAKIEKGTSAKSVLYSYGQPHIRAGEQYRYCALKGKKAATVTISFRDGQVSTVSGDGASDPSGNDDGDTGKNDGDTANPGSDGGRDLGADDAAPSASSRDGLPDTGGLPVGWPLAALLTIAAGALLVHNSRRLLAPPARR